MRKPEQKLWDKLRSNTKDLVDWTRVETANAGAGIPDLDGIGLKNGLEFKLELKVCSLVGIHLSNLWRPSQIAWQTRRARYGGCVYNLVHHLVSSSLLLHHGRDLIHLARREEVPAMLRTKDDGPGIRDIVLHILSSRNDDH